MAKKKLPAGWTEGSVQELLDLSDEEMAIIETRSRLAERVRKARGERKISQGRLAERIDSTQPSVARMEQGLASIEMLIRALLALGIPQSEIGGVVGGGAPRVASPARGQKKRTRGMAARGVRRRVAESSERSASGGGGGIWKRGGGGDLKAAVVRDAEASGEGAARPSKKIRKRASSSGGSAKTGRRRGSPERRSFARSSSALALRNGGRDGLAWVGDGAD